MSCSAECIADCVRRAAPAQCRPETNVTLYRINVRTFRRLSDYDRTTVGSSSRTKTMMMKRAGQKPWHLVTGGADTVQTPSQQRLTRHQLSF